jgi:hypothetical protein
VLLGVRYPCPYTAGSYCNWHLDVGRKLDLVNPFLQELDFLTIDELNAHNILTYALKLRVLSRRVGWVFFS